MEFKNIEIAGPGFLNIYFYISFWRKYLAKVIELKAKYGSNKVDKKRYNVEFVSANPTGPLHVGHCRGAILGDVLSNLLSFNGNEIDRYKSVIRFNRAPTKNYEKLHSKNS